MKLKLSQLNNVISRNLIVIFCTILSLSTTGLATSYPEVTWPENKEISLNFNFKDETNPDEIIRSSIAAGDIKNFVLEIENTSGSQPVTIKLYPTDATINQQGNISYKLREQDQLHIGDWLTPSKETVTIPPAEKIKINFTIAIPSYAAPGNYAGALMGEVVGASINEELKINIRKSKPILLEIPGEKKTDFLIGQINHDNGGNKHIFKLPITNRGNTILQTDGDLTIEGTGLSKPINFNFSNQMLIPGEISAKEMVWENPPLFGSYKINSTVKVSSLDILTNQKTPLKTTTEIYEFYIFPTKFGLGLLCLLTIIILSICVYKRKYQEYLNGLGTYTVQAGDSIKTIADNFKIDWKKLAKINKINKPYSLKNGKILKIPRSPQK